MSEEYTPSGSTVAFTVPVLTEAADGPKLAKDLADDVAANYATKTAAETLSNKTLASPTVTGTLSGAAATFTGNVAVTGGVAVSGALTTSSSTSTTGLRNVTFSTADPTLGDNGDIWLKYTP